MSRPINADALKEFIESAYRPLCDDYHMKDYVLDQILTDIENEPTIDAVPHWIPCNERLPEFDVKVLAYVKNKDPEGRFNKDGIYTAELKDKVPVHDPEGKRNFWGIPGYDSEWTVWAWSYFTEPNVLAWMPLPKPYEVEDEKVN